MIGAMGLTLRGDDPLAVEIFLAIRGGNLDALRTFLARDQGLANARTTGDGDPYDPVSVPGDETPLHYAAGSDDVDVAEALIEAGADIEAPEGSIGTPLANAIGYACWNVARLLVARGARVESLWQAAALGDRQRLDELIAVGTSPEEIDHAFFQACHGGQLRIADHLLSRGADVNASPDYAHGQTVMEVAVAPDTRRQQLVSWLRDHGATEQSLAP
jgi:ankyrin repeat protein